MEPWQYPAYVCHTHTCTTQVLPAERSGFHGVGAPDGRGGRSEGGLTGGEARGGLQGQGADVLWPTEKPGPWGGGGGKKD